MPAASRPGAAIFVAPVPSCPNRWRSDEQRELSAWCRQELFLAGNRLTFIMTTPFVLAALLGFPIGDVADDAAAPFVLYVLAVPQDRTRPVELVRFVDSRIAGRSPPGDDRAFDFGRDGNWLAIVYHSQSEGRRASLWDLATGKRRADNPLTGPEIVSGHRSKLQHPHAVLILDPTGSKAVASDGYDCGSIDLLTGKRTAFKPPGRAFG